jgi:ubiquinone/menaquinone biosynthesis C-methylase UbiE
MMSDSKQHEIGIAGLALLRNWLVGDEKTAKSIMKEVSNLTKETKSFPKSNKAIAFDTSEGYKVWAKTYDTTPNLLFEVEEPVVKKILKELTTGVALDAACGTGRYSELLNTLGYKVTGMDLSLEMLAEARRNRNKKINFIEGDLTAIPLKNKSVDLAISALAFTHLPNIEKALSELKRVVRLGGNIVISDINPWLVVLGGQADFVNKEGTYGYVYNHIHWHSDYFQAFQKLGLEVIGCYEPKMQSKHMKLAKTAFDLTEKTVATALEGLPIALIWVLKRQ